MQRQRRCSGGVKILDEAKEGLSPLFHFFKRGEFFEGAFEFMHI
jgi:hypothetical protein